MTATLATRVPEHPASGQLALFALCGQLVIAIEAMTIHEIRRAAETEARAIAPGMWALQLDDHLVPGWDLGELFGVEPCTAAWVIVDLPAPARRAGFRIGRCFMVQPLPVCRAIPSGIFTREALGAGRPDAITAGFSAVALPGLAGYVSGVVVDLRRILSEAERVAAAHLARDVRDMFA